MENNYSNLSDRNIMISNERRNSKRVKYCDKIKIVSRDLDKVDIEVIGVDISIYGIGFKSQTDFKKDEMLEVLFYYDSITIPAIIQVSHSNVYDDGFFIGGKFIGMQNLYREILRKFISE